MIKDSNIERAIFYGSLNIKRDIFLTYIYIRYIFHKCQQSFQICCPSSFQTPISDQPYWQKYSPKKNIPRKIFCRNVFSRDFFLADIFFSYGKTSAKMMKYVELDINLLTENSFRNQNVFAMHRLIWSQTDFRLVDNRSENGIGKS